MTGSIAQQIEKIRQQIPGNVRLIAVTKQMSVAAMREAYGAGIRDFGENRLQEALPKQEQLQDLSDLCWHFIGHLQSNKAKKVLENFQWIHSVDSLKIAQRLNRLAAELHCQPCVCLQVKVLPDPQKYGWEVPELLGDLPELNSCEQLKIKGLMTILPLRLSELETRAAFEANRNLAQKINSQGWSHVHIQELSMGMSGDYQLAIQGGATMIRLGRAIFGERNYEL